MIWTWVAVAGTALGLMALIIVWRQQFVVVTVLGESMLPAYRGGDRVLARRQPITAVHTGHVVVIDQSRLTGRPRQRPARWIIKRVIAVPGDPVPEIVRDALPAAQNTVVPPDHILVIGDNPSRSTDSRVLGYIPASAMLGVIIHHLHPGTRDIPSGPDGRRRSGGSHTSRQ